MTFPRTFLSKFTVPALVGLLFSSLASAQYTSTDLVAGPAPTAGATVRAEPACRAPRLHGSTARQRYIRLPAIRTTISSKCRRSPAEGDADAAVARSRDRILVPSAAPFRKEDRDLARPAVPRRSETPEPQVVVIGCCMSTPLAANISRVGGFHAAFHRQFGEGTSYALACARS